MGIHKSKIENKPETKSRFQIEKLEERIAPKVCASIPGAINALEHGGNLGNSINARIAVAIRQGCP